MNFLAEIPEGDMMRALHQAASADSWIVFYQLVADGAPLDVKDEINRLLGGVIKLGDEWFEWSAPGNILYGFYGAAWGFTGAELHGGAAFAQFVDFLNDSSIPLGIRIDTDDDYYAIKLGIGLFQDVYSLDGNITAQEFESYLSNYEHFSDLALVEPSMIDFQNADWPYSQGYFYNDQNPPNSKILFPSFVDD